MPAQSRLTIETFERRCSALEPGFSVTEDALACESAGRLVLLLLACAVNRLTDVAQAPIYDPRRC